MGPNDENNYVMMTLDGQPVEFADFSAATTTGPEKSEIEANAERDIEIDSLVDVEGPSSPDPYWDPDIDYNAPCEMYLYFGPPVHKRDRCKRRKRFIKLLMADGYSRNEANFIARAVQSFNKDSSWRYLGSYQGFYENARLVRMGITFPKGFKR